jgi:hypothetical protein
LIEKNDERWYEAEVYRIKGELTLQQEFHVQDSKFQVENPHSACPLRRGAIRDLQSEAEACFLNAIEVAQKQQAKSWEPRAAISLARLWQQGKKEEAHHMLSEVYNWFMEGFDTKDLQEAKTLLDELQ